MARSNQSKEKKRLERIAQKHPENATDRCYEYARIKKLENRVLNKQEKHAIKMKDSVEGRLTKLNEQLLVKNNATKITKRSKHVHEADQANVQTTDFGADVPYFQSSQVERCPPQNEIILSIMQLLEAMPVAELISDCQNPKISRIIQNTVRHCSKDEMTSLIKILFREKRTKGDPQSIEDGLSEGLCLEWTSIRQILGETHEQFLQNIVKAPIQEVPRSAQAFLGISANNYASFIVCALIRHAPHTVFAMLLYSYCIPYLPIILTHKSTIRILHFLSISRFCAKKERNSLAVSLVLAAIGSHRNKITQKAVESHEGDTSIQNITDLLERETRWWGALTEKDRESTTLHAHCALLYLCQLFVEKIPKAITFPICIAFIKQALSLDARSLPADIADTRSELIVSTVNALVDSAGVLFTASAGMATEWSEETFAMLSLLVRELSDEQLGVVLPAIAPYLSRVLAFVNKPGRYGSQRLVCALIIRCSASQETLAGFNTTALRHMVHADTLRVFVKNCVENEGTKRRRRQRATAAAQGLESVESANSIILIIDIIARIAMEDTAGTDALNKSFFGQYPLASFRRKFENEKVFLILMALVHELHRFNPELSMVQLAAHLKKLHSQVVTAGTTWATSTDNYITEGLQFIEKND